MYLLITVNQLRDLVNQTNAAGVTGVITSSDIDYLSLAAALALLTNIGISVIDVETEDLSKLNANNRSNKSRLQ